ncbi:MAG TPA: Ig-like domain repeat protein [Acidimicrobiales bacterium]|nr:Ig-like domain repeat protein [Acidimicrobiales bacterium]
MALFGSLLGLPLASAPAGAVAQEMELAMVPGGGTLVLRDSEEPAQLGSPTTLTGTIDDANGALTGGVFTTPTVEYQFDITSPVPGTVYVDATFSEVAPGTVTGSLDDEGNFSVEMMVKADLHIELNSPPALLADCTTPPIPLRFVSTAPYDREGTKQVTLRDADFTVPTVPTTPACPGIVADAVNERLAGGGHSLELRMQGEIPEVKGIGDPTTTALSVEPAVSRAGDDVVLAATVTTAEGGPEVPTGAVEFRNGPTVIGSVALDGTGVASLTVSDLAVGQHTFSARYIGDGALHQASRSTQVAHLVAAAPTVEVAMGDALIGGGFVPATVTVTNPEEFGADIVNGRVDLRFRRPAGQTGDLTSARIAVEWRNGGTWEPLTLATVPTRTVVASIGLPAGFRLDAGTEHELRLRVRILGAGAPTTSCSGTNPVTCPGPVELSATLNEVNPGDGTIRKTVTTGQTVFTMVETTRRDTTLTVNGGAPRPHSLRAGYTMDVVVAHAPNLSGVRPSGSVEFYVDGRLTPARRLVDPLGEYNAQVPIGSAIQGLILLPPDIEPGPHSLAVRYLGDKVFKPAEAFTTFTVFPAVADSVAFVCQETAISGNHEFGANVTFDAAVPETALSGTTVDLDITNAVINMSRPGFSDPWQGLINNVTATVGDPTLNGISFGFGPDGAGTAASVIRTGATPQGLPNPVTDLSQLDQKVTFNDPIGSVTVAGAPGDVVPVTLDEVVVTLNLVSPPLVFDVRCTPVDGEPMVLGEVEIAGTSVSVSPTPARERSEVTVEARTFPSGAAGTVAFSSDRDGALGTEVVSGGVASVVTDELSPGVHVVTAAFNAADPGVPDSVGTATVVVTYSPRTETEAFVVAARTDYLGWAERDAVVADAEDLDAGLSKVTYLRRLSQSDAYLARLVDELYQDTLGRPADEAGKAFWIGRLRDGWSVAKVTASFYGSGEYFADAGGGTVETWVDDLYVKLLGRPSDAAGRAYWVAQTGRIGRGGVALRLFQSRESARSRVVALYDLFLGRSPSSADRDFWAARVVTRGDLALAVELTVSDEYAGRAENRFPLI